MPSLNFELDVLLRLLGAISVGLLIGFNRDLRHKAIGMRTLALVSLGTATVALAALEYSGLNGNPEAISRVIQGVIQGVLAGIGFIGAGVIMQDRDKNKVHGLTTAATVWVTAALALACALAAWWLALFSTVLAVLILIALRKIEKRFLDRSR